MKIFKKFKNEVYSKKYIVLFILLFAAYVLVTTYSGDINNFFGFPDVTMLIEDEESPLLGLLIDYHDFSEEWKISDVYVLQDQNVIFSIKGEYQDNYFRLHQYINLNDLEGRYDDSENRHYEELYVDNDHTQDEINTYCYFVDRIDDSKQDFTSCTFLQEIDGTLIDIKMDIDTKLDKGEVIQLVDEMKGIMGNINR